MKVLWKLLLSLLTPNLQVYNQLLLRILRQQLYLPRGPVPVFYKPTILHQRCLVSRILSWLSAPDPTNLTKTLQNYIMGGRPACGETSHLSSKLAPLASGAPPWSVSGGATGHL